MGIYIQIKCFSAYILRKARKTVCTIYCDMRSKAKNSSKKSAVLPKTNIKKINRRAGGGRMVKGCIEATRKITRSELATVFKKAVVISGKKKTVKYSDILNALSSEGVKIYGSA